MKDKILPPSLGSTGTLPPENVLYSEDDFDGDVHKGSRMMGLIGFMAVSWIWGFIIGLGVARIFWCH